MSDPAFTQDDTTPHSHKCGLISGDVLLPDYGCGHVWAHVGDPAIHLRVENHKCPKCGRGPWYHLFTETV